MPCSLILPKKPLEARRLLGFKVVSSIINSKNQNEMIVEVGDVLVSTDIFTEEFCCDLSQCKGQCCIEGDAGAPVSLEEVSAIEGCLDAVWRDLSAQAQCVLDKQGVAYVDQEGDLVTSIVNGKDCVFTCYDGDCCLCAIEKAQREGRTDCAKPISCALYPIREKVLSNGMSALNYNRWTVCHTAVKKGREIGLPVYRFLERPLKRRFGEEWYALLLETAEAIKELKIDN